MRTRSEFKPPEKNPGGEIHEDPGVFSCAGARETFVLRSFYVEGSANTYVLEEISADGGTLTCDRGGRECPSGDQGQTGLHLGR